MGSRLLQRAAVSTLFALRWREVRFTMISRWAILLGYSVSLRCPDSPYTVATFGFHCTRRQVNRTRLSVAAGLDRAHARGQALPGQLTAPGRCCGAAQLELQCDAPRRDCRHRHGALRCATQPRAHHQACFASICFWPRCGVLPSSDVSLPPSWRNLGHHRPPGHSAIPCLVVSAALVGLDVMDSLERPGGARSAEDFFTSFTDNFTPYECERTRVPKSACRVSACTQTMSKTSAAALFWIHILKLRGLCFAAQGRRSAAAPATPASSRNSTATGR
eukprot:COSAG04_NODE_267_length_18528_cov_60.607141_18_plen_276_part_00